MGRKGLGRIETAVESAEAQTDAEVVVVIMRRAADYRALEFALAAVAALLLPVIVLPFAAPPASAVWSVQLIAAGVGFIMLPRLGVGRRIVGGARHARDMRRAAANQFHLHGLDATQSRAGVLVLVSLADQMVEIMADRAAEESLTQQEWDRMADLVAGHASRRQLIDGVCGMVAELGVLLAERFPPGAENPDELPNVIRA